MLPLHPLYALVVLLTTTLWSTAHAHGPVARPLKRVAHPSTLSLDIIPRTPIPLDSSVHRKRLPSPHSTTLRHDDSFRLTLSAFDETFFLHLRPNDELIQSKSRIHYYDIGPDGRNVITHSKPLLRESYKVYWGEVIAEHHSPTRLREDAARIAPTPHPAELGWARIMIHHQGDADAGLAPEFEGAFSVHGNIYHIVTKHNYLRTKHDLDPEDIDVLDEIDTNLIIWRESDMMTFEEEHFAKTGLMASGRVAGEHGCGHDRLDYNRDPLQNPILRPPPPSFSRWYDNPFSLFNNASLAPRDDVPSNGQRNNFRDTIGQTNGCPTSQKIVLMGVAADCVYVEQLGSQENATRQILNSWNLASTLFKNTFNVTLGILHLEIQNRGCPTTADPTIPWNVPCGSTELETRLSLFSDWRGKKGNDSAGLWHLMSGCPTGTEVGIAWLGTLCRQTAGANERGEVVSGTAVSTSGRLEWQVVAHEIGHNFGAIHDCSTDGCSLDPPCCPLSASACDSSGQFLMSPVAQSGEQNFSPCSIGNVCTSMRGAEGAQTDTSCLIDPSPDLELVGLEMCGNGIVERGEDCDPGQGIQSNCCDSTTCKFKNGAVCDPDSSLCCTDQCTFAPATQTCRPSKDPLCDTAEMCTGNSSACPADIVATNGRGCGNGDLRCASGLCTSVSLQCQMIGGSMGLREGCPNRSDNSCQVSCKDPNVSNQCRILSALLVDGSPCGFGGTCLGGRCQAAGALDTAKAWYTQNLQIAIPVTIVAGLVALLLLWAIFRAIARCCCGSRRPAATTFVATVPPMGNVQSHHQRLASYDRGNGFVSPRDSTMPRRTSAVYSPVPNQQFGYAPPPQSRPYWVDDTAYNGPRRG